MGAETAKRGTAMVRVFETAAQAAKSELVREQVAAGKVDIMIDPLTRGKCVQNYMRCRPRGGRAGVANITTGVAKAMHRRRADLQSNWAIIK